MVEERATAYVCRQFACEQPVTTPEALAALVSGVLISAPLWGRLNWYGIVPVDGIGHL